MAWVALAFAVAGSVAEGAAEQRAATQEAFQMRRRAGVVRAQSQKAANEEVRQAQLVESRARALAGASGAAVDDKGMRDILGDIAGEGEYRSLVALWNGEEEAIGLEYGADNKISEGKAAMQAGVIQGVGTAIGGYTSMKGKYGSKVKTYSSGASVSGTPGGVGPVI